MILHLNGDENITSTKNEDGSYDVLIENLVIKDTFGHALRGSFRMPHAELDESGNIIANPDEHMELWRVKISDEEQTIE